MALGRRDTTDEFVLAFCVSGLFIFFIGENPLEQSCNDKRRFLLPWGYRVHAVLYNKFYFHWTSSCSSIPRSALQYRWEGQAYVGGLGVGLVFDF